MISETDRKDVQSPESDVAIWREGGLIGKERKASDQNKDEQLGCSKPNSAAQVDGEVPRSKLVKVKDEERQHGGNPM